MIQIIEADQSQCLLMLFTRHLVYTAENTSYYLPQWSTRNQNCTSAVLSKVINLEYSRICKIPTAWRENNAKGCFDRIIPSLAVLNCRRYGAPRVCCKTLAKIWNHLTHILVSAHETQVPQKSITQNVNHISYSHTIQHTAAQEVRSKQQLIQVN